MSARFRHLALHVSDLRAAESYYAALLGLTVLFREARVGGEWATLPEGRGWAEADGAGLTIELVALRRDDVVITLFKGAGTGDRLRTVGLMLSEAAVDQLADRAPRDAVTTREPGYLELVDPYGVRWQLASTSAFRSSGERAGRWIDL